MVAQVAANIVLTGSIFLLVGLGFGIHHAVLRFLPFTYAALVVAAPYATLLSVQAGHVTWPAAIFAGLAASVLVSLACEAIVLGPLRRRESPPLMQFLASLGAYVVLVNSIAVVFGNDTKRLVPGIAPPAVLLGQARLTAVQVAAVISAVIAASAVSLVIRRTRWGLVLRAVADDAELAEVRGVASSIAVRWATIGGGFLAGLAGLLLAFDIGVRPTLGVHVLFAGVVTCALGGSLAPFRQAVAAISLSALQHVGGLLFGSEWKESIVFAAFLLLMLLRRRS